jgi:hypothetical protein
MYKPKDPIILLDLIIHELIIFVHEIQYKAKNNNIQLIRTFLIKGDTSFCKTS